MAGNCTCGGDFEPTGKKRIKSGSTSEDIVFEDEYKCNGCGDSVWI